MARSRGRKTDYDWNGVTSAAAAITATQAVILSLAVNSAATLMRSRGSIAIEAVPDAIGDSTVVGLGLMVVRADAAAVGGTSVPGPIDDDDGDWLWHQYVPMFAGFASEQPDDKLSRAYIEIDSKAMRRLKSNDAIVLIGELSGTSFASVQAIAGVRFLTGQ